jgi:hypothetical protein
LDPLYANRRILEKPVKVRPHFAPILAFVYRNRFAIGSQIQRRFPSVLKSERTCRRHLEELQVLGLLDVVPTRGLGSNFPKVYFVTAKGIRSFRRSLAENGTSWEPGRIDRAGQRGREGYAAETVIHELLTTEFLLALWQTVQNRLDLELLSVQRRSLAKHDAFRVSVGGRQSRLVPDAMFLFHQQNEGMCSCFLELDNGTMNRKQLMTKFRRYDSWGRSARGQEYLTSLYRGHGAESPRASFRILVVARDSAGNDARRTRELAKAAAKASADLQRRTWLATTADLCAIQSMSRPLEILHWQTAANFQSKSSEPIHAQRVLFPMR